MGLVAAVAIMMILSTVAMQHWADVVRRDNEAEMMFRAQEIVRAIRKFQKDKPGVPLTELKLLIEPGNKRQYFLRKLYKDPLVKDGKWGLLYAAPQGGVYDPTQQPVPGEGGLGGPLGGPAAGMQTPQTPIAFPGSAQRPGEVSGLPIVGVKTLSTEKPFRIYKDNEDYARWLFTVFDLDQQIAGQQQGNPPVGSAAPPTSNPPTANPPTSNPPNQ